MKDYNKEPNYIHSCDSKMLDEVYRDVFRIGYSQAEKDTIERAIDWLKDYVKYFEIYDEKGVEEFRKAMEEKK